VMFGMIADKHNQHHFRINGPRCDGPDKEKIESTDF
jgi:hypothetical protein